MVDKLPSFVREPGGLPWSSKGMEIGSVEEGSSSGRVTQAQKQDYSEDRQSTSRKKSRLYEQDFY